MTTAVTSIFSPKAGTVFSRNETTQIMPGETLTNAQAKEALIKTTSGGDFNKVVTAANAGNNENVSGTVEYKSGITDWIANNPGLTIGAGLLIAWGLFQLF